MVKPLRTGKDADRSLEFELHHVGLKKPRKNTVRERKLSQKIFGSHSAGVDIISWFLLLSVCVNAEQISETIAL